MTALTFRGWLAHQRDRDDAIGDLAGLAFGGGCRGACRFTDYPAFTRHVVAEHEVPGIMYAAMRKAGREYAAYSRRRQLSGGRR